MSRARGRKKERMTALNNNINWKLCGKIEHIVCMHRHTFNRINSDRFSIIKMMNEHSGDNGKHKALFLSRYRRCLCIEFHQYLFNQCTNETLKMHSHFVRRLENLITTSEWNQIKWLNYVFLLLSPQRASVYFHSFCLLIRFDFNPIRLNYIILP